MKKRFVCFAMAVICLALSLTSCADRLTIDGRGLTHKKTGITYAYVMNMAYQPIEYESEPFTKLKYNDVTVDYYAVKGLEPSEWLYSPLLGELVCATGAELPELEGFGAEQAFICIEATNPYSIYDISDKVKVDAIVAKILDENTPTYSTIMPSSNYTIKFTSKQYPQFYYSLVLVADEDGVYVHDRMNKKYIDMGSLFDEYELYDSVEYDG